MIRKAVIDDADNIAKVHSLSWQSTYKGIINDSYLDGLDPVEKAEWWTKALNQGATVYLAEINESIVGFAIGGIRSQSEEISEGELFALYLLKDYQGLGLGKQLFDEVKKQLTSKAVKSMIVWVLNDNPSKDFYVRMGGTFLKQEEIKIGDQKLMESAYVWNFTSSSSS